ncbi:hypothetical protein BZG02_09730 [Labilibaculum filiforme]|uniref:Uncharacterized protein n=2 Tax=Labilibaculum filiforme TaxID=1940526 RepID=A0A2N3HYA8_9BACT|nr:hypothetical protein BZG02_09730 [Labilibaculum filiforme]
MGVDFDQLCSILTIKIRMDNRRSLSLSKKKTESNNQLWLQSLVYAFLGGILVASLSKIESILVTYTIFFAFIMIMIAMLMISEFTTILMDTRDNNILMPRPINSRTLVLAKILHIAFYMLHLSFSLSLVMLVSTLISHGFVASLLLILLLVLSALFTLFLTNIFYLGLMNVVNGQKLKDIIVYFQIVMAILFMGAYQLVPRMMEMYDLSNIHMNIEWYSYLIPPVWMSAGIDAYISTNYTLTSLIFFLLALFVPLISLFFVIKVLAPKFNKALSQLDTASNKKVKSKVETKNKTNFIDQLATLFTKNSEEATVFKMVWLMSGRERKFKQTVYPAFGYIFIFILMFLLKSNETFSLEALAASKKYLFFIYMPIFLSFAVTQNLCYSDQAKSSWFYRALPLALPGTILRGSFKSGMVKYYLPVHIVIAIICLFIWGYSILDDLIYSALCIILLTSLIQSWQQPQLPFTAERETQDIGGNFVKGILLLLSIAVIGGIHYGLSFLPYSVLIAIPILLTLVYLNFRSYRKITWEKVLN